ncbi:MAG: nitroreductase family deazaflavin-dependent oxidoreductase [Chloroflexota bacterium]|nr:nitroreductase family deazaflavin-dependent oxidoreductase [Chloroflexota bacterium]
MDRRALVQRLARAITAAHVALYRARGGRLLNRFRNGPVLLLTTQGRKTGRSRTTPLLYIRDGDDYVVVASNGGMDWEPAWWLNLRANPVAQVEAGSRPDQVRAERVDPAEQARLWPRLTRMYPGYDDYQRRVSREIAVVRLRPVPR